MMQETKSTCCYCGVGCGVIIRSENDHIVGVRGDPDHPANFGRLCTKGSTLHLTAREEKISARALYPELRTSRQAARSQVSWEVALDHIAQKFADTIQQYGPDSVAFYISGQLLTEDYYVFNKLAKGLIGTNNVDTNSRLCMSSAVAGYKATLGADAPPACYEDIDHTACLFIAGSNTAFAHPIVFRRIEDAKARNPNMKIIVVDPRRTDTAQSADLFLPIQPGTDVALFNAMLHVLLWDGLVDMTYINAHTTGFENLRETVRDYSPKMVSDICGVPEADIITAAKWFGAGPTLSMYCQGLNQSSSGTDKNAALINLHLATGQIGKLGAGPFSLTGQPNAMGGREVGGMANLLSAHRNLNDPQHRAEVATLWGVENVPENPGKTAVEMFDALKTGEIKAIWIACTNPAQSMPDLVSVTDALRQAEFVVLQDAYHNTDTAPYADVLLPATSWGEKEGTVTNSERCITHIMPSVQAPGESRADWAIVTDFAQRLGAKLNNGRSAKTLFPYQDTESVFNEHRETTRGRDLDITGLSYAMLDSQGPQQWPLREGETQGQTRLYADGIFPQEDGRAKFSNTRYIPVAEKTDARYPLHFNTGRLRDQWHGMSRTGTVAQLYNHSEEPILSMHSSDMGRRGLINGDIVKASSRRGSLVVRVKSSDEMMPTQTYMPMHWGRSNMNGMGSNVLTTGAFDPISKQPELKHAAIRVEKLELPWRLVVMRRGVDALALMHEIQPLLDEFDYATCGLYGRDQGMLVLRAANKQTATPELIARLDMLVGLTEDIPAMTYSDPKRGISKRVAVENGKVTGVRLLGETLAAEWLKEVMTQDNFPDEVRLWALAPVSAPPSGKQGRGRIVCSCLDISENEINAVLAETPELAALQHKLKCGTECGSCVPELKRLAAQVTV